MITRVYNDKDDYLESINALEILNVRYTVDRKDVTVNNLFNQPRIETEYLITILPDGLPEDEWQEIIDEDFDIVEGEHTQNDIDEGWLTDY